MGSSSGLTNITKPLALELIEINNWKLGEDLILNISISTNNDSIIDEDMYLSLDIAFTDYTRTSLSKLSPIDILWNIKKQGYNLTHSITYDQYKQLIQEDGESLYIDIELTCFIPIYNLFTTAHISEVILTDGDEVDDDILSLTKRLNQSNNVLDDPEIIILSIISILSLCLIYFIHKICKKKDNIQDQEETPLNL